GPTRVAETGRIAHIYSVITAGLLRARGAVCSSVIMADPQGTAGSDATAGPAVATGPDIVTLLCNQPVHCCWRHQEEVETALGLEKNAIGVLYQG
ncbi:unnamed protein product, partial [Ectocarpus sp. 12 AP-2014]